MEKKSRKAELIQGNWRRTLSLWTSVCRYTKPEDASCVPLAQLSLSLSPLTRFLSAFTHCSLSIQSLEMGTQHKHVRSWARRGAQEIAADVSCRWICLSPSSRETGHKQEVDGITSRKSRKEDEVLPLLPPQQWDKGGIRSDNLEFSSWWNPPHPPPSSPPPSSPCIEPEGHLFVPFHYIEV